MRVLVLGGAGFIGSHACVALAERGHDVAIVDNHANSSPDVPARLGRILGTAVPAFHCDVRDTDALARIMSDRASEAVLHFAALKSVARSVAEPLAYFYNNIAGTISVLEAMRRAGARHLVFSSSATVYGAGPVVPVREDSPLSVVNPYGRSKLVMEQLIADVCAADPGMGAMLLRYFNPVGAHPSGLIGEDPRGVPDNLMPYVAQVAVGRRDRLRVFGGDWPTRDGTGVRDYVHVMDLAEAHADALDVLARGRRGATAVNLGTGRGTTVLELVRAFERASGREIPFDVVGRRPGDVAELWASTDYARDLLGWHARRDLDAMCADAWRWQSGNSRGDG
jgi:UDP-glucose 4-epimerase